MHRRIINLKLITGRFQLLTVQKYVSQCYEQHFPIEQQFKSIFQKSVWIFSDIPSRFTKSKRLDTTEFSKRFSQQTAGIREKLIKVSGAPNMERIKGKKCSI